MPKRRSYGYVLKEFNKKGYTLLDTEYRNNKQKLRYVCGKHPNTVQSIRFNDISSGHGCRLCKEDNNIPRLREMARKQRIPFEDVNSEFEKRGYKLLETDYKSARDRLKYLCPKHPDKDLKIRLADLKSGNGCRYCAIEAMRLPFDEVKELFNEKGYELLDTEYKRNQTPMRYVCPNHRDKETYITVDSLKQGHGCNHCAIDNSKGELSVHYKGELTSDYREKTRLLFGYDAWRRAVRERDAYTCTVCGHVGSENMIAHHKDGYLWCKERRLDITNGATLCDACHKEFHSIYGYRFNTQNQFDEWVESKKEASE